MNNIDLGPLATNIQQILNNEAIRATPNSIFNDDGNFSNILKEAFETTTVTDAIDKTSSTGLLTGESDDLSGMLIDMQKAELSLQLTLQIRNKILDAYNEVMRMSV